MTAVLLSPHHDDETLFAAFTIMRERPKVIVVLESHLQAARGNRMPVGEHPLDLSLGPDTPITDGLRRSETFHALTELLPLYPFDGGVERSRARAYGDHDVEFWPFRDDAPDWPAISDRIWEAVRDAERVYAPCPYEGEQQFEDYGHEHHDQIGKLARAWTSDGRLTLYHTYRRGAPDERVTDGTPVAAEPWMVARKLRALACYRSQIELWPHHFLADQREFYA